MMFARMARFGGVSAICLGLHNTILVAADALGFDYGVALLASFAIVVVVGFILHSRFTFGIAASLPGFVRYSLALIVNVPVQWVLLGAMIEGLRLPMLAAAPLSTATMMMLNFIASRWALRPTRQATLAQGDGI